MRELIKRILTGIILALVACVFVFCGSEGSSDSDDDDAADDGTDDTDDSDDDGGTTDDTDDADDDSGVTDDDYNPKGDHDVSNYASSGCLSQTKVVHDDGSYTIELDFLWDPAGVLTVNDGSSCRNCAYYPVIRYSINPGQIDIYYNDPEGWGENGMAACDCLFDYTYEIPGLTPDDYLIQIGGRYYFMRMPADESGHEHFYLGEGGGCG